MTNQTQAAPQARQLEEKLKTLEEEKRKIIEEIRTLAHKLAGINMEIARIRMQLARQRMPPAFLHHPAPVPLGEAIHRGPVHVAAPVPPPREIEELRTRAEELVKQMQPARIQAPAQVHVPPKLPAPVHAPVEIEKLLARRPWITPREFMARRA